MDRYFPVISKTSSLRQGHDEKGKKRDGAKYHPYRLKNEANASGDKLSRFSEEIRQSDTKPSSSALTKFLLDTLGDESNPITHSDIYERSDHVVSLSTGHQVNEGVRDRRSYLEDRARKLVVQREMKASSGASQVLSNVRVWIDGYLENTTDIEIKRIVIRAGGQVLPTASGCTHILTSQPLSGSKTHRLLTAKTRNKIHVVKPEWVFDSIEAGRRRPEREYAIVKSSSSKSLHEMLQRKEISSSSRSAE
ncbi:putative BRCT domain, a BRCA1 C-terminus domain contaning protein [Lyophyllum shimeji]|uniref:BRCT domain, a BRCA1 C-terminus domain contaning protein n=1 Tax=Lyophyllum shimeji TaxID=47721 RepID=A0A9P3PDA5_LYOSH|nr:putative BRCT domain, a BRCA1 C-terminus domain contaning protein [Lyophyllum shimeji]